jgi:hypothetical protein
VIDPDGRRELTPLGGVRIIPANVGHGLRRAHAPMAFSFPGSAACFARVDFAGSLAREGQVQPLNSEEEI